MEYLVVTIVILLLILGILSLIKRPGNKPSHEQEQKMIEILMEKFVSIEKKVYSQKEGMEKPATEIEESLLILFRNLTTTYKLFNIVIINDGPITINKAYNNIKAHFEGSSKFVSETACAASFRLLNAAKLIDADVNAAYFPTELGRKLYRKFN